MGEKNASPDATTRRENTPAEVNADAQATQGTSDKRPIAILCDTTAPLSRKVADELGVTLIPMHYLVDGVRLAENYEGENGDYDTLFRNARILGTEAVYQNVFAERFSKLLEAGSDILCLTISSRLSGTYRSARAAEEQLVHEGAEASRMAIVDSWTTSGGLEFLVRRAHERVERGESLSEIAAGLKEDRKDQGIVFTVPDIDVLRRSGRLGATRGAVVGKLDRYLIMALKEGGIEDIDVAHGMRSTARALAKQVPHELANNGLIVTGYGEATEVSDTLVSILHHLYPDANVAVRDGNPVVSLHLGVGSISLAWRGYKS